MAGVPYEAGKLYGEDRDPTLEWEGLRGLGDERLGKLLRALGKTAGIYREAQREANCPPLNIRRHVEETEEDFEASTRESQKFSRLMAGIDGFIGKAIVDVLHYSDIDPNLLAMYSKSVVFKEGEPVLYVEHWVQMT